MQGKSQHIVEMKPEEMSPIGFNARYFNPTLKPYKVSRGKTRLVRRTIILIFTGLIISLASIHYLPEEMPEGLSWLNPVLWLPRMAAFFFILLAILRIRELKKVKEFLVFDEEGLRWNDDLYTWKEMHSARARYSIHNDEVFDLVLETDRGEIAIDLRKVDEFSEDVVVVFHKYWRKFKGEEETS